MYSRQSRWKFAGDLFEAAGGLDELWVQTIRSFFQERV